MAKFYTKTHKLKKAAERHAKQIQQGGGKVGSKKTKSGTELTYYYPSNALTVKASNLPELIKQAASVGTKTVEATFVSTGKNKKGKKELFNVIDEGLSIMELTKSKDVVSLKFKK